MTDGTTGIQVAPTAEDMSMAQSIFQKAADAIVGMSQLKADVDMLRQTVQSLQSDLERLRSANAALDDALAHVRQERDTARADAAQATARANEAEVARDSLRNQVNDLSFDKNKLQSDLDKAKAERDDHGFRVMELEEELRKANAKLDSIREGYRSIFGEEPKALQPEPQLTPVALEPTQPVAEAPKPAEPAPEVDWSKPYHWDAFLGRYVNDAA